MRRFLLLIALAACHRHRFEVKRDPLPLVVVTAFEPGTDAQMMDETVARPLELAFGQLPRLTFMRGHVVDGRVEIAVAAGSGVDELAFGDAVSRAIDAAAPMMPRLDAPPTYHRVPAAGIALRLTVHGDALTARHRAEGLVDKLAQVDGTAMVRICGGDDPKTTIVEHDGTDDRGVDVSPYVTQVHLDAARADAAARRLAAAGFVVFERGEMIVRIEAIARAAADQTADRLARVLHVVSRAVPTPTTHAEIDQTKAIDLGVDLHAVESAVADALAGRTLGVNEWAVLALRGTTTQKLDAVTVRSGSGERVPLSRVVTLRPTIAPSELVTIGDVPAVELRVSDSTEAIAAAIAAHPVEQGVAISLIEP